MAAVATANGQALFTGETGGKGSSSLVVSANASFVRGFTTPLNCWTAYTRGIHARVDAFALYGNLTMLGETQHYVGLGSNLGILQRARHGVDVAFLSLYSMPLNHRHQAATVWATFAPLVSRPLRVRRHLLTLYTGYLRSEFFGARAGKLFTPPKGAHNGIAGAVLPVTESISVVVEYDPGSSQQNVGAAVLYVFPRK